MRSSRLIAAVVAIVVSAGCAPEMVAPGGDRQQQETPGLTPLGAPSAQDLRTDLITLANYILPNNQSILGKFDALVAALGAGTGFGDELDDLISKINLEIQKYTQPPRNGSLADCVDAANPCTTVAQFRDMVIADIYRFVGLDPDATICRLPAGHPNVFCEAQNPNGEEGAGFVYFPPALFNELTFVSIKALNQGVGSGLDEYGFSLEIRTAPISVFGTVRPTVVACVPNNIPDAVLDRLLLGHRRAEAKYDNPEFSLLPDQDLSQDALLEGYAKSFCGEPVQATGGSGPTVFGLSVDSPLNRLLVGARDFLLPSQLSASNAVILATRGFSGASGSPEEFSTFRAVDRGVTGAGGSPEEFAPQASEGSPATGYQGAAGTSTETGLPHVIVQTEGGRGVAGVLVTFALINPVTEGLTASEASLCLGHPATVETDANGMATLSCLNFGTKAGYKNLQVTFDPTEVFSGEGFAPGEQPCMIGAGGVCDNSVTANFRIETVPGPAAQIFTYMPTAAPVQRATYDYGLGVEDAAVADAPQVRVLDAYGNPVGAGVPILWSPLTASNGAVLVPGGGSATTALGLARTTSWTLGAGANSVIARLSALGEESPAATFTATTPSSGIAFSCQLGGSKTDLGLLRIPRSSNRTMRTITVYMSVTGQASSMTTYPATIQVRRESGTPLVVGSGTGGITLPGNNGNPTAVTFELSDLVLPNETNGSNTLWIEIAVTAPSQRKFQVWHNSGTFRNSDPCNNAWVYAPGSTTSFKRGLSIIAAF